MTVAALRVSPADEDFAALVRRLDDEFFAIYGDAYLSYQPHNAPADLILAVVAYADGVPAASGGLKRFGAHTAELKRLFVRPEYRRLGLARCVVLELENAAREQGFLRMVLETGADMPAAIALYQKLGYALTDNYGPYADDSACVCMTKNLPPAPEVTP